MQKTKFGLRENGDKKVTARKRKRFGLKDSKVTRKRSQLYPTLGGDNYSFQGRELKPTTQDHGYHR